MGFCDAQDVIAFVTAKALDECKFQRVEPKFTRAIVVLDMNVRRLEPVGHVKEEAITTFAQNGRHIGILMAKAPIARSLWRNGTLPAPSPKCRSARIIISSNDSHCPPRTAHTYSLAVFPLLFQLPSSRNAYHAYVVDGA